jgi:hypothetical protein
MTISYEITGAQGSWTLTRNGVLGATYATAEGAFEVATAQASIEIRSDHDIEIHVRPRRDNKDPSAM